MKLILFVMLLFVSINSFSEDNNCKEVSNLAKIIMEYRQTNGDLSELIDIVNQNGTPEEQSAIISIIKSAYSVPLYETDPYKERKISEFKNEVYLICIQN